MTMQDLVLAGAPELPARMFYRVTEDGFFDLAVEVRQRRRRFGSRKLDYAYVYSEHHAHGIDAIVDACKRAVASVEREAASRQRYRAAAVFAGDHDPKGGTQ